MNTNSLSQASYFSFGYHDGVNPVIAYFYPEPSLPAVLSCKVLFPLDDYEMRDAWSRLAWAQDHPFKHAWYRLKCILLRREPWVLIR